MTSVVDEQRPGWTDRQIDERQIDKVCLMQPIKLSLKTMGTLERQQHSHSCNSNSHATKIFTILLIKFRIIFLKMQSHIRWAFKFKIQSYFNVESSGIITIVFEVLFGLFFFACQALKHTHTHTHTHILVFCLLLHMNLLRIFGFYFSFQLLRFQIKFQTFNIQNIDL